MSRETRMFASPDRSDFDSSRVLSVGRVPHGDRTEWPDESGIHRRAVSGRSRSEPGSGLIRAARQIN